MNFRELVLKTRTVRRFYEDVTIETETLTELIDISRYTASPRNRQALKYSIENRPEKNAEIFKTLAWAGALPDWDGPEEGERPAAYIIVLGDDSIEPKVQNAYHEAAYGIVSQTIMLAATEIGLGGCTIVAVKRKPLAELLNLPEHLQILCVLALGKPKEIVVLDELNPNDTYNYWRDTQQVHHVPKRKLSDIIFSKPN